MALPRTPAWTLCAGARKIYRVLRARVPRARAATTITYADLGRRVGIHHHSSTMEQALLELVNGCRALKIPAIAALVVRGDTGTPGAGYYEVAHRIPMVLRPVSALAWAREVVPVSSTRYPPRIRHGQLTSR